MTGEEGKVNQRERRRRAVRKLRDAHAPIDRAVLRLGIHAGGFANIFRRHTGKFFGIFGREFFERFKEFIEAFGAVPDEIPIDQILFDDDMRHR